MSKSYITLLLLSCLWLPAVAQTQQGYVKTLGRANQKGQPLSGVTVRARGGQNAVLSRADGTFNLQIQGSSYILQQVNKQGYELKDAGMIGRKYAYSKSQQTIVMISKQQHQADIQRLEDKFYAASEKSYKAKIAALEKQRASNAITIEQYQQQMQTLQTQIEKNQSVVEQMAEYYASSDYDDMDELERGITRLIEAGDLDAAYAQLQQSRYMQNVNAQLQLAAKGNEMMAAAQEAQEDFLKEQERRARFFYDGYTIALLRFDNDSARFYIESRAALDTTNVRWQIDAGEFVLERFNQFAVAKNYFLRAMRHAAAESFEMAECYNDIGLIYLMGRDVARSFVMLDKSLKLRQQLFGDKSKEMAIAYSSMATLLRIKGNWNEAFAYYNKSIECRRIYYGEQSEQLALAYHNIATVLVSQKRYAQALEYLMKAATITDKLSDRAKQSLIPAIYSTIASTYVAKADAEQQQAPPQVITFHQRALQIRLQVYGETNLYTAASMHNLGTAYVHKLAIEITDNDNVLTVDESEVSTAYALLFKAIEVKTVLLGKNSKDVKDTREIMRLLGQCCYMLGVRNQAKNDVEHAVIYYTYSYEMLKLSAKSEDAKIMKNLRQILGEN